MQGTDVHLLCAKLKLHRLAQEQHGLYADERGQSEQVLQAKYLRELGGPSAILRLLQPPSSLGQARPIGGDMSEWMTLEGQFIAGLVDGRRSVKDIVDTAKAQKGVAEFATVRLLQQLMKKGCIGP